MYYTALLTVKIKYQWSYPDRQHRHVLREQDKPTDAEHPVRRDHAADDIPTEALLIFNNESIMMAGSWQNEREQNETSQS